MSDYYEKDGKLYEKGLFNDREIGDIEHSLTGDYVKDGLNIYDVNQDLGGKTEIITDRNYWNNEEKGVEITKNPFQSHGQESHEFMREIWNDPDDQNNEEENETNTNNQNSENNVNQINSSFDDDSDDYDSISSYNNSDYKHDSKVTSSPYINSNLPNSTKRIHVSNHIRNHKSITKKDHR